MDEQAWRPLFDRDNEEQTEFDVLHEGIPHWLDGSLWRWVIDRGSEGAPSIITRLERRLHMTLAEPGDRRLGTSHTAPSELLDRYWALADDNRRLVMIDALLADLQIRAKAAADSRDRSTMMQFVGAADRLQAMLAEGGSAWGVHTAPPAWGLTRRVGEATQALVERISRPDTDAARKIRAAWHACYRHDPDPDAAYRQAVLAVEAVTIPVTIPGSTRASLGGVSAHIRDTLPRWSVAGLEAKEIASGQTLYDMVRTLWHNQERHARPDGSIVDVSQAEAEAAVSLAVTLVHWFTSGLVKKSDDIA